MVHAISHRFWDNVDKSGECWLWTAGRTGSGYGAYRIDGMQRTAHRIAFEATFGSVPDGLDLDHLCRNRACVNPEHLEPVTRRVNLLRSPITITARNAMKTECVNGHAFTTENTMYLRNGTRRCRACRRASAQRAKRKAVA